MRNLAYLSAPTGLLAAVDCRAKELGMSREGVLSRAGLTEGDWNALASSLAAVDAKKLLRALNAVGIGSIAVELPHNPSYDQARSSLEASQAGQFQPLYGDLA
ncbi:MAG: hypothetical protein U1E30_12770 [Rhodoblastus sp.]